MYEEQVLPEPPRRPTVVTVFAILTLVMAGISLVSTLFSGLFSNTEQAQQMEEMG